MSGYLQCPIKGDIFLCLIYYGNGSVKDRALYNNNGQSYNILGVFWRVLRTDKEYLLIKECAHFVIIWKRISFFNWEDKCGLAFNHQRTKPLVDKEYDSFLAERIAQGLRECWDYDPDMRPTIQEIVNTLTPMASQQIIQNLKNLKLNHGMFLNRHEIDRIYFRTIKYMHQFSCRYTADLSNYFRTELMEEHYVKHMACAIMGLIEKGKSAPCLSITSVARSMIFTTLQTYLFVKLLTIDIWKCFRDCDYEIHEGRESIIEFVRPIQQKEADVRRLTVWN
ncbi:hypothetical protein RhiirC2_868810 [Rhizophagus irregularis]|uniref:Uncharacterized protein n=1 Tax=Rhizophagus irregularis TaxID=588596 RepID=A0A2N1MUU4_9GLOM|nr:hypothetical protein RhiirC2_868810 [Rhizophagus irregularis]